MKMKMKLATLSLFCGLLTVFLVDGCTPSRETGSGKSDRTMNLKVLQFNIWLEGSNVENGSEKIVDVIIASGADVVTFSEVQNYHGDWHAAILKRLREKGCLFYGKNTGSDVGLISRYPIIRTQSLYEGKGAIRAFYLDVPNQGKPLLVCSAHLDYKNYALYLPRGYNGGVPDFSMIDKNGDGEPDVQTDVKAIQVYNEQSEKDEAICAFIKYVGEKVPPDLPIILAGDFNDGSHLDWTRRAGKMFDHHDLVIPWQNSVRLQEAGFVDAYRKIYPDEVQYPGITWPSVADGKPLNSWVPKSDERDRIDFVYYKGNILHPRSAYLVGPRLFCVKGCVVENRGMDRFICEKIPWPTDHKGVLIEFEYGR